jgi:uncharacterized membrane protein YoaT (DUF817 family)
VLRTFWAFVLWQTQACLFGGLLLTLIMASTFVWPPDAWLTRYDALFIAALLIQALLLLLKLETLEEMKVIFIFHVVGTVMEVFKTHMGSWTYPEENVFRIGGVPLFTGFMYSAVGSYIARSWRLAQFQVTPPTPSVWMWVLAVLIYVNFFTHHFTIDIRLGLFAAAILIFGRSMLVMQVGGHRLVVPLLLAFLWVAGLIWVAENIGSLSRTWIYPDQVEEWRWVSLGKLGSWYLLMIISWALVAAIRTPDARRAPA